MIYMLFLCLFAVWKLYKDRSMAAIERQNADPDNIPTGKVTRLQPLPAINDRAGKKRARDETRGNFQI